MRRINRLNEEIARWAFEILFRDNTSWQIAFTNPTAGPWKTIRAKSLYSEEEGEVYRFILEEDRPDIILFNDALRAILIIEAKDSLEKLLVRDQASKSAAVVLKLAGILRAKADNPFWRGRENYKIILGLLWGSTVHPETDADKDRLYNCYQRLIAGEAAVEANLIIGIETLYHFGSLGCSAFFKGYDEVSSAFGERIVRSLVN